MSTDQITPALCRELGMVEDKTVSGSVQWSMKFQSPAGFPDYIQVTIGQGDTAESLTVWSTVPCYVDPTASNLRSIIEQLTPHEEWLRGRLRLMNREECDSVAALLKRGHDVGIDQAAAIITGANDA